MSSHIEIANLRGTNAGLRQRIADGQDLTSKLESDIRDLEKQVSAFHGALLRIAALATIGSTVHSITSGVLVQFNAE